MIARQVLRFHVCGWESRQPALTGQAAEDAQTGPRARSSSPSGDAVCTCWRFRSVDVRPRSSHYSMVARKYRRSHVCGWESTCMRPKGCRSWEGGCQSLAAAFGTVMSSLILTAQDAASHLAGPGLPSPAFTVSRRVTSIRPPISWDWALNC